MTRRRYTFSELRKFVRMIRPRGTISRRGVSKRGGLLPLILPRV